MYTVDVQVPEFQTEMIFNISLPDCWCCVLQTVHSVPWHSVLRGHFVPYVMVSTVDPFILHQLLLSAVDITFYHGGHYC